VKGEAESRGDGGIRTPVIVVVAKNITNKIVVVFLG
jgi:hypothetical protein